MLRAFERAVTRWGVLSILSVLAVTALLGTQYARLSWTNDPEVISLEGSDALDFYRGYVERWGSDELIVLAYEVADAFEPSELERLRALTDALLDVDGVAWVSSLDTAFVADTGPFGPYARPLVPDRISDGLGVRDAALASPFVRDSLVSSDAKMLLLAVQLEGTDFDNSALERRVLGGIDEVLARPEFATLAVDRAGSPVFNRALSELNQRDNAIFTPLALGVIAVLLSLLFRNVLPTALALAVVGVSVVWTLGLMSWLGIPMNITTSLLPPLLMVIAVADAVHILSAYIERLRGGESRGEALSWTLNEIVPACFWTSLTTALGFGSLLLVRIESVRTFGLFAVVGVAIAFLHAVVLLPALMVRLPLERSSRRRAALRPLATCSRLARRPSVAIAILAAAVVTGAVGLPRIEVATHDGEFFRESHPINRAYRRIESRLEGVTPFEIELQAEPGALRTPGAIRSLHALQQKIAALPELTRGTSLADLLIATSPGLDLEDDDAVERALFLVGALAPGEVERWLRDDASRARVSARAVAMTSARSGALMREVDRLAVETLPGDWTARATGLVPVFSQMEQYLVEGQLRSYGFAAATIGLVFAFLFRSVSIALLALAVNLIPIAVAAGIMGLAGIRLDVATIMVASVALGIIVDDTIHLLTAYRRGLETRRGSEEALDYAIEVAGRPVLVTSLILVCGFGTLTISGFQPTAHFGLLVCIAVAGALVADLVILPAGLRQLGAGVGGLARRGAFKSSNPPSSRAETAG